MKKTILLIISLYAATTGLNAYASEYLSKKAVHDTHKTYVDVGGSCCAMFNLSTKVGHLENGQCHYEAETPATLTSICDVHDGIFTLDGNRLKEIIGSGWECAATHVTSSLSGNAVDEYSFINDENGNYLDSNSSAGKLSLPLCH